MQNRRIIQKLSKKDKRDQNNEFFDLMNSLTRTKYLQIKTRDNQYHDEH